MMAASVALTGNVNVSAATKKLSVNRVYENAAVIKGKTKRKCSKSQSWQKDI